jgi:DNA processing protein
MPSSWKPPGKFAYSIRSRTPNPDESDRAAESGRPTVPAPVPAFKRAKIPDAWLRLLRAAAGGGNRWIDALRSAGSADNLVSYDKAALRRVGLRASEVARLKDEPAESLDHWTEWLRQPEHDLIVYGSDRYPERLAEIDDPPLALWANGSDWSLLQNPGLAMVGSRHPTINGCRFAAAMAERLSNLGITIISGLALGIDASSHRGALGGTGKTIAVLGNGIDHIYPRANRRLGADIQAHGLIVSEYGPTTPVRALQFPRRNRIIAALSLGTLVVEATRRSGSLITARLANEYGREVFAVPGSVHSALSKGCHKLVRDGAKLVEDIDDILLEIAPQLHAATEENIDDVIVDGDDELPAKLADCLNFSPVTFDSLVSASGLTAAELSSMLLHLEIQGKIEALPGGRYCRLAKRA